MADKKQPVVDPLVSEEENNFQAFDSAREQSHQRDLSNEAIIRNTKARDSVDDAKDRTLKEILRTTDTRSYGRDSHEVSEGVRAGLQHGNLLTVDPTIQGSIQRNMIHVAYAKWQYQLQGVPANDPRVQNIDHQIGLLPITEQKQINQVIQVFNKYNHEGHVRDIVGDLVHQEDPASLTAATHRTDELTHGIFHNYALDPNSLVNNVFIRGLIKPTQQGPELHVDYGQAPAAAQPTKPTPTAVKPAVGAAPAAAQPSKPAPAAAKPSSTPAKPASAVKPGTGTTGTQNGGVATHASAGNGPAVIHHRTDKAKPDIKIAPATIGDDGTGEVPFATGSDKLNDDGVKAITQIAEKLKANGATHITLTGHADTVGSDNINNDLSQRRAESVMAELKKHGITADMEAHGVGKTQLEVKTADGVANAINRSVEIKTDASTHAPTAATTPTPPASSVMDASAGANMAACPPGQTAVLSDTDKANVDRITDDMSKRGKDTMDFTDASGKPFSADKQQAIASEVKHHLQETRRPQMKLTFGHMAEAQQDTTAYQERFNMNMDRGSLKCLNSKAAAADGLAQQAQAAHDTSATTVATTAQTGVNKGVAPKVAVPAH